MLSLRIFKSTLIESLIIEDMKIFITNLYSVLLREFGEFILLTVTYENLSECDSFITYLSPKGTSFGKLCTLWCNAAYEKHTPPISCYLKSR